MSIHARTVLTLSLSLVIAAAAAPAHAAFTAVGVYDENTTQLNTVDTEATSDANANQLGLASFSTLVSTAFANGFGGVVDFDTGTINQQTTVSGFPYGDSFDVSYAGGTKSLNVFDQSVPNGDYTGPALFSGRTPISGGRFLAQNNGSDFLFNFGTITGGAPDEAVVAVGFTLLSRDDAVFNGGMNINAIVTFSDGSTTSALTNLARGNGTDDTFFAFQAPENLFITRLVVDLASNSAYTGIDDLAFVTKSFVPEPGSLTLLGLAGAALLRRRR